MRVKTGLWFLMALSVVTLAGCGSGGGGMNAVPVNPPSSAAPSLLSITISPSSTSVALGSQRQLTATGNYSAGPSQDITAKVTWNSSASSVAAVNKTGVVTGNGVGQANLTATSGSITGSATLNVTDNLVSISISSVGSSVDVASTLQLTAMGTYQDGKPAQALKQVTWTSSATSLASVSGSGLVSGIKGGTATITASDGAIKNTITLTVIPVLQSILVSTTNNIYTVQVGSPLQCSAIANYNDATSKNITGAATWTSTIAGVAAVSSTGSVKTVASGTATIKAAYGGLSGYIVITVKAPPAPAVTMTAITISPNPANAILGLPLNLTATGKYSDSTSKNISASVTWSSSAPAVASIGSNGFVMPLSIGQSTITAISGSLKGSTILTVTDNLVSISISSSGASVDLGGTLQLSALGAYQDGKPPRALGNVTWSSSANGVASVSAAGLVNGIQTGNVTITATSGSISEGIQLTVVPVLTSLTLSPTGPAVVIGGKQQFAATGKFNDGSVRDVTSSATWSSSDQTKATISNGDALGVAVGPVTIEVSSGGVNATTALNVVSSVYADLLGGYIFTLTSADARGPSFFIGQITADGNGNISGVEDANTGSGVHQNVAVAGNYLIYPDGRGTINLNPNLCHPLGITLRVMLSTAGTLGSLAEFDTAGDAKGALEAQEPAVLNAAAIKGNYVFRASGIDYGKNPNQAVAPIGEVGVFSANGTGNISGGAADVNDSGHIASTLLLASSYSVDSNGRGTLQLTTAAGPSSYALYVVNRGKLDFIQIDSAPAAAVTGVAEIQTTQTYGPTSLKGNYVFLLDRPIVAPSSASFVNSEFAQLGQYSFSGTGLLAGLRNNVLVSGQSLVSSLGVNGRGTFTATGCDQGSACTDDQRTYVFYFVSPEKMFLLQSKTSPVWRSANPVTGEADLQIGKPYTISTLKGTYILHPSDPIANYAQKLLWLNSDGAGHLTGIADVLQNGELSSTVISNGRYANLPHYPNAHAIGLGTLVGMPDYLFYPVSPAKSWVYGLSPAVAGGLDRQ